MRDPRQPQYNVEQRDMVDAAEAGKLEAQLRRAVDAGNSGEALGLLRDLERLAAGSTSRLVVTTYLLGVVRTAPIAAQSSSGDLLALARDVVSCVEPWFSRPLDDFSEVGEGGRHAALHTLMHVAAQTGRFEQALTIRALDNAGNARCVRRWAEEMVPSSPGCHAHYPNAYGTAQLVGHLVAAGRFAEVPGLLGGLEAITGLGDGIEAETLDACAEEEVGALDAVLASNAPEELTARSRSRREAVARMTERPGGWPRTRARLGLSA